MNLTREQAVELACGIQGWMNRDELGFLYDRAGEVPPGGTWVEVGTWKGRSAIATGLGLSKGSTLVCVDNFQGNPESSVHWESQIPGWLRSNVDVVLDVLNLLKGAEQDECEFRLEHGDSVQVAEGYDIADVIFIDASHTYDALCRDIRAWLPRVNPGGLLCGHDLCSDFPDVERAVRDTLGEFNMAIRNQFHDTAANKVIRETNAGTIWWWRKPL